MKSRSEQSNLGLVIYFLMAEQPCNLGFAEASLIVQLVTKINGKITNRSILMAIMVKTETAMRRLAMKLLTMQ